jgi:hypothetical protein
MLKRLAFAVTLLFPALVFAQISADPVSEAAVTAYQQGIAIGKAIQQQKDAQDMAALKAQLEVALKGKSEEKKFEEQK